MRRSQRLIGRDFCYRDRFTLQRRQRESKTISRGGNLISDGVFIDLIRNLRQADSFEAAAVVTLSALQKICAARLSAGEFADSGKILRALAHLRPAGGYRGLVILEHGEREAARFEKATLGSSLFSSATAWTLLERHGSAIVVDVREGRLQLLPDRAVVDLPGAQRSRALPADSKTLQHLLDRDSTHVLVIPMIGPGKTLHGMISIEAHCPRAVGSAFIWPDCYEILQLLADAATPTLVALPLRTSVAVRGDALLPVVGASMENLINLLKVFAEQDETILLSGVTGVGKSRLAAWCHTQSGRRDKLFQTVDLLTVPEEMQMAELFGWRKGSFTGALGNQQGCVARAEGGTLFIDEIDKLSLSAQAGLLQLLETRRYRVLGDPGELRKADVRFIIGTNADLKKAVADGRFRQDLYFRINVLPVRIPPLSERSDEIADWARFMVLRRHREMGRAGRVHLNADAALSLSSYSWPGNLRQLDNVLRRAYAIALAEYSGGRDDLTIALSHIEQALGFEAHGEASCVSSALRIAARAYADAALQRAERGEPLDIHHASAFRGLVLQAAFERLNDIKQVYLAFGQQRLVDSRNHSKHFRAELDKVKQLDQVLDKKTV